MCEREVSATGLPTRKTHNGKESFRFALRERERESWDVHCILGEKQMWKKGLQSKRIL